MQDVTDALQVALAPPSGPTFTAGSLDGGGHRAAAAPAPGDEEAEEKVEDDASLDAWVGKHVAGVFSRPLGGQARWCPRWREHPEAVVRLGAARDAWRELWPKGGTSRGAWLREHLDPQLAALLHPAGPFAACGPQRHEAPRPLPVWAAHDGAADDSDEHHEEQS